MLRALYKILVMHKSSILISRVARISAAQKKRKMFPQEGMAFSIKTKILKQYTKSNFIQILETSRLTLLL